MSFKWFAFGLTFLSFMIEGNAPDWTLLNNTFARPRRGMYEYRYVLMNYNE